MIDLKKASSLNVGSILTLSCKEDYDKLIKEMENPKTGLLF